MENHGETEFQESQGGNELKEIVHDLQEENIQENIQIEEKNDDAKNEEVVNEEVNAEHHFEHPTNDEQFVNEIHVENVEIVEDGANNKNYEDYVSDALNEEDVDKIVVDDPVSEQDASMTEKGNEYVVAVVDRDGMEIFVQENDQNVEYSQNSGEIIHLLDTNHSVEIANQENNYSYEIDGEGDGNIEILKIVEEESAPPAKPVETKDYRNAILEDWDMEVVPNNEEQENGKEVNGENVQPVEEKQINNTEEKNKTEIVEIEKSEQVKPLEHEIVKPILDKALDKSMNLVKYSNIVVTKKDIVDILDKSVERIERPIIQKKDIFFNIELTKRLNQKLTPSLSPNKKNAEAPSTEEAVNNNAADEHQKIVDILEADEIKDWKPNPDKKKTNLKDEGSDLEISLAILHMEKPEEEKKPEPEKKTRQRKSPVKKNKNIDKELERTIALQQLRDQFPSTRRKSKTTKKVNHIPFVASTDLEKALVSSEEILKPATPKRRPCYLPEKPEEKKSPEEKPAAKKEEEIGTEGNKVRKRKLKTEEILKPETLDLDLDNSTSSVSNSVVRTYSAKRKSTDAENEIKSTLQKIVAAAQEVMKEAEEEMVTTKTTTTRTESPAPPKKPKTVKKVKETPEKKIVKKKKKKQPGEKKRNSELEKLLGDEGAIRMIYDTQQDGDVKKKKVRTTTGLKKDLMLKTKLVKNAVMRLSGVSTEGVSLRGKRKSGKSEPEVPNQTPIPPPPDPLFESSTPSVILYKPKKKQKAEASRILYRHSSSESFDDTSEGYRRKSFDVDGLNLSNIEAVNGEVSKETDKDEPEVGGGGAVVKPKRTKVLVRKKLKRADAGGSPGKNSVPKDESKRTERMSADSRSTSGSKLQLSNVPVRKSSRPRVVSKKYSIWASTSMDSLSVESLGLKKPKKASHEFAKKLNCKELIILQHGSLVQVVLAPVSTGLKNSLNVDVLKELITVLEFLSEQDSCKAVLLASTGSTFCQGIDLSCLVPSDEVDQTVPVDELVENLKKFIKCLSEFQKVVIAGVQGGAVGLGVTILPFCDVVLCSDKASFYTPYMKLGQVTEGAATVTFPRVNRLLVSELLYKSLKLTPSDALKYGLVSQILPEERFEEDLMLISRSIASQPWQSMQSIKSLLRRSEQEEIAKGLELECDLLKEHWSGSECVNNMIKFMNSGELQLRQVDGS